MISNRLILVWALLASLVVVWLAVERVGGDSSSSPTASTEAVRLDDMPLVIWVYGAEAQQLSRILPEYQRAWPRQEIRLVAKSWGEFPGPALAALAPNERPDLLQIGSTWVAALADSGLIMPLDDRLSAGFIRPEQMIPQSWNLYRTGAGQLAIPWYVDLRALYYRTDIVASPPRTWEELRTLAQRLRVDEDGDGWKDRYGLSFSPDAHNFLMIYWASGGSLESLNQDALATAFDRYLAIFRDEVAPIGPYEATRDPEAVLALGYTPMMISGPWHIRQLEAKFPALADSWATAPLPRHETVASFLGGAGWAIPVGARNVDGAWNFIEFMTHADRQSSWWEIAGALPANRDAWNTGFLATPALAGFRAALDDVRHPPVDARWAATEGAWSVTLRAAVHGRIDRARALADLRAAAHWLIPQATS